MDSTTISGSLVVTDDTTVESASTSVDVGTTTTLRSSVVPEVAVVENDSTAKYVCASTISIRTSSVSVEAAAVERDRDGGSVDVCTLHQPW